MLHLIRFRTFIFSTWVWSVLCVFFVRITVCFIILRCPLLKRTTFRFVLALSRYGNGLIYLVCCQRLTKFEETTGTCFPVCLHWFVPIFRSWVFFFFCLPPVFGLGLIFCSRPRHSWQHDKCLQATASLACRQMNITVSHSALTVSVFVKTESIKVSNVLKLTNGFFLCFHEFVFARHVLVLFLCFLCWVCISALVRHRENIQLVSLFKEKILTHAHTQMFGSSGLT